MCDIRTWGTKHLRNHGYFDCWNNPNTPIGVPCLIKEWRRFLNLRSKSVIGWEFFLSMDESEKDILLLLLLVRLLQNTKCRNLGCCPTNKMEVQILQNLKTYQFIQQIQIHSRCSISSSSTSSRVVSSADWSIHKRALGSTASVIHGYTCSPWGTPGLTVNALLLHKKHVWYWLFHQWYTHSNSSFILFGTVCILQKY